MLQKKEGAFSLIELSIVLVIMGLLIAGLSSGASLIKNAELRSVMSQAENIRVAVNAYYLETGAIAGDDNSSSLQVDKDTLESGGAVDLRGNGDGLIQYMNSDGVPEGVNAWTHMTKYEVVNNTYNVAQVSGSDFSEAVMPAKKNGGYWVFGVEGGNSNFVYLVSLNGVSNNADLTGSAEALHPATTTGIMNGADAESFEKRYDDGAKDTGAIRYYDAVDGFSLIAFSVDM